jgi:hypothetical protein
MVLSLECRHTTASPWTLLEFKFLPGSRPWRLEFASIVFRGGRDVKPMIDFALMGIVGTSELVCE